MGVKLANILSKEGKKVGTVWDGMDLETPSRTHHSWRGQGMERLAHRIHGDGL